MRGKFLQGKTCLVTGGAQGIGWAIAQALADFGGTVFVCDINRQYLDEAQAQAAEAGWPMYFALCDVSDAQQAADWVRSAHAQTGRVDVLVNNAAFYRWLPFEEMTQEDLERMTAVCYHAVTYTTRAVLPFMRAQGDGHLINISSSAGKLFTAPGLTAYAAVKAAVDAFTQALQLELRGSGITATTVRLGIVAGTDFFRKNVQSASLPRLGDLLPSLTPPDVANGVLRILRTRQARLDLPGYLRLMYLMFEVAPWLLVRLVQTGGAARRDYGAVDWRYSRRFPK